MAVGVSFQSAAKSCLIPWNGSLAPELFSAKPQKMAACAKMAFPACAGPLITALGAFDEQRKFVLQLSEKRPPRPFLPYFQSAKLLQDFQFTSTSMDYPASKTRFKCQVFKTFI
jgi:hypothetical protein